jgi:hypothetical protein
VPLPGITLNTSAIHYRPIKDGCMAEFRDGRFVVVSEMLHGIEERRANTFNGVGGASPPHVPRGRVARGADKEDRDAA